MRKIVVGVLGAGRIGKLHADNLLGLPGVELKTIADPCLDPDSSHLEGVELSRDPGAVIGDQAIEAVLICSPTSTHADLVEEAARAGKHVFCEKPIDLDPKRAQVAVSAAETAEIKFQVGFNRRFDPNFQRLKRAVEGG